MTPGAEQDKGPSRLPQEGKKTSPPVSPKVAEEPVEEIDPDIDPDFPRHVIQLGNIELILEPGRVRSWEEFKKNAPPFSIAVDGYCEFEEMPDPVYTPPHGPKIVFDHHHGVRADITPSVVRQVSDAVRNDLMETFQPNGNHKVRLYVNHVDWDTLATACLLSRHEKFTGLPSSSSPVEELVSCLDEFDRYAGGYRGSLSAPIIRQMAWIFEPYTNVRREIEGMSVSQLSLIFQAVQLQFNEYVANNAGKGDPKADYKNVKDLYPDLEGDPNGWVFITEEDPFARVKLRSEQKLAFIYVHGSHEDGSIKYSVGKLAPYAPTDIQARYTVFNAAEELLENELSDTNRWDGSDIAGGSPRATHSFISLQQMLVLNNRLTEIEQEGGLTEKRVALFIKDELVELLKEAEALSQGEEEDEEPGPEAS